MFLCLWARIETNESILFYFLVVLSIQFFFFLHVSVISFCSAHRMRFLYVHWCLWFLDLKVHRSRPSVFRLFTVRVSAIVFQACHQSRVWSRNYDNHSSEHVCDGHWARRYVCPNAPGTGLCQPVLPGNFLSGMCPQIVCSSLVLLSRTVELLRFRRRRRFHTQWEINYVFFYVFCLTVYLIFRHGFGA